MRSMRGASERGLDPVQQAGNMRPMKFLTAIFAWLVIAAILATGIVLAAKGSLWLLVLGLLGFIVAFAKYGCASH